jgi:hypothetical protein
MGCGRMEVWRITSVVGNNFCSVVVAEYVFKLVDAVVELSHGVAKILGRTVENFATSPHLLVSFFVLSHTVAHDSLVFANLFGTL